MTDPILDSDPADTSQLIRDHVSMIHQLAEGIDGVLVVSVFNANLPGDKGLITHHRIGDVDGMAAAIEAHADTPGANVYAGLQVMRRGLKRGQRGGEADVVAVLGLVADMDTDTGHATGAYPVSPNLVLETSRGNFQPFWLFCNPIAAAEAKVIARGLKAATGSDHGTADIAHVWRVAGTLNWPSAAKLARGRGALPAHISAPQPWDGSLTDPLALLAAVGDSAEPSPARPKPVLGDLPDLSDIDVSDETAEMLAADDVGDRSAHAARVVEQLNFDAHTADEAAALFLSATGNWFQRYANRDALADFRRLWAKFAVDRMYGLDPWFPQPKAANDNDADWIRDEEEFKSDAVLSDLTRPGGFVEELIDWIVSSAEHPSRELALSAVLPFVGALIGRRFSGYRDARSNIYSIALAPSGYGKDHARQQIKRLISSANLHSFSGPARIMSASALRNVLIEKPSVNCQIDEIAGPFREMLDPRAGTHQQMLKSDLLEYFSTASTYFEGAAYANSKAVKIEAPNLCIYGTSTGDDFWNSVSGLSLRDGFLARLLLFNIEGSKPGAVVPAHGVKEVPEAIRIGAQQLATAGRRGRHDKPQGDRGELARTTVEVALTPDAEHRRSEFKADIQRKLEKADGSHHAILNRAVEHAVKLALIVAVASAPETPAITGANMAWAIQVSWLSCCALMRESALNIADGAREAAVGKVLRLVRDAGADGLTIGKLTDRTRGLDQRIRREILQDLMVAQRVIEVTQPAGPKGGKPTQRFRLAGKLRHTPA